VVVTSVCAQVNHICTISTTRPTQPSISLGLVMPKFHYADFHRNFPAGKVVDTNHEGRGHKRWQIMKPWSFGESREHTNHLDMSRCLRQSLWQIRDKAVYVTLMEFSPLQCTGKVGDKVRDKLATKSRTQIMKVSNMICVANFHDLCLTLSGTCCGLCRKVGIMEFEHKSSTNLSGLS